MLKKLKAEYQKAVQKEKDFQSRPHSIEERRAHNQKAGWAVFGFGLILLVPNLYLFFYEGKIWILLAVLCLFCIFSGIFAVRTGKLIGR